MPTESSAPQPGEHLLTGSEIKLAIRKTFYGNDLGRLWFTLELPGHSFYNLFVEKAQKKYGEQKGYWIGHLKATSIAVTLITLFAGGLTAVVEALGFFNFLFIMLGLGTANLLVKAKR